VRIKRRFGQGKKKKSLVGEQGREGSLHLSDGNIVEAGKRGAFRNEVSWPKGQGSRLVANTVERCVLSWGIRNGKIDSSGRQ